MNVGLDSTISYFQIYMIFGVSKSYNQIKAIKEKDDQWKS